MTVQPVIFLKPEGALLNLILLTALSFSKEINKSAGTSVSDKIKIDFQIMTPRRNKKYSRFSFQKLQNKPDHFFLIN